MSAMRPDASLKLVLGSASARRLELLAQIGLVPDDVRPPDIDETPKKDEPARDYVRRIARQKAQAIALAADEVLLCADTTVALGRRIMGKPADRAEAQAFLKKLSGRRHRVITAIAVRRGDQMWEKDVVTQVAFKRLSDQELNSYLNSQDWQGKAGGYAIQGPAGAFVPWINGSFSAVVGLPLEQTAKLLSTAGYPVWKDMP
ncbi:MAG: septum formation inhibitor Maf [Rhodobacteraceae bacterium]|nr:septum formation inhibitor Maf [Paracoccaceae bacterium]